MSVTDSAQAGSEADARVLEAAAAVLKRRFGMLTAGDLIAGLTGAAGQIRGPEEPERVLTVEDTMDYNDPVHPHGYWEEGDYS